MTLDLYLGDGIEIIKNLDLPGSARFIFDPPYGTNFYKEDKEFPIDFYSWVIDNFQTVAFFGYPELLISTCVRIQKIPYEWVTWNPSNKFGANIKRYLPRESECIAIFGDLPNPKELKRKRSTDSFARKWAKQAGLDPLLARLGDVWNDPSPGVQFNSHFRKHPNEKPVSIMKKLIVLCSNEGDLIIDPCMGSGTTGVACIETGRNFIGIEISPEHYKVAEKRISDAKLQIRMKI